MAYVGVRVEPTVRLGSVGRACEVRLTKHDSLGDDVKVEVCNVLESRPVANKPIVRMTCFGHVSFCGPSSFRVETNGDNRWWS